MKDPLPVLYLGHGAPPLLDRLAAYATRATGMPYAHPTVEHFTPIFVPW